MLDHKLRYHISTDKLHDELELLKIKDIKEQEILAFVHNFFSNNLPAVFNGYFKTIASITIEIQGMEMI